MNIFIIRGFIGGRFFTLVLEKYSRFMIQNGAESTSENRKNQALLPIQLIHVWGYGFVWVGWICEWIQLASLQGRGERYPGLALADRLGDSFMVL